MKNHYIYALAVLASMMVAGACQKEFSLETDECQVEEIHPGIREVRHVDISVNGFDDFVDTKGAITSGGVSSGKWNAGETKINSWKLAVYDADGDIFTQTSGTALPSGSLVMDFPVNQDARVVVVANLPNFSFPSSYADWQGYTFHFTKENLISGGVPATADIVVSEGESYATLSLRRLVAKINFKLSNPNFRAFSATEVSLHDVAMDSRSGAADGYVVKDFDSATASELASINAGTAASDTYTVSFICPENLKGTVTSIGNDPKKKVPANAPVNSTYLEVKGHVTNGGFGDGDVTYRFYLGSNATTNFDLKRNNIYNVTLSIDEGKLADYEDGASWKVDVGDFDYTQWDYWWQDPTTGFTSKTCVIGERKNAKLFVRMPEYCAARDPQFFLMLGTASHFEDRFDPDDDEYIRSLLELDGELNYFDGEPYYNNVGYFCYMDEYEDPQDCLDNYGTCCSKTRMAFSNTLRSSAVTNSNVTTSSFNTGSLSNGGLYDYLGVDCCEKLSWKGYYVSNTCSDANKGCYIFDIQATTVTNASDDVDFGDWAWVLVYYDEDHCFSIPVYVSENKLAFNVNTQGQYAYVGQKLNAASVNGYGTVNWTLTSGSSFVGLNSASGTSATGTSVSLVCKAKGTATLKCTDGAGKTYTKTIEVKEPVLQTKFRQLVPGYSKEGGLYVIRENDFAVTLDGEPNSNFAWWYVTDDANRNKITFSDQSVFNTYVGTHYESIPSTEGGISQAVFNQSIGDDFAQGNCGECTGLYVKNNSRFNSFSNSRTVMNLGGYPMRLFDNLSRSTNEKTYTDVLHNYIPCPVLNPLYACRGKVGLTNATKMTGLTCTGRTTSIPKTAFYNVDCIKNASAVSLVKSTATAGAGSYQVSSAGEVSLVNESSDTQGFHPVAQILLNVTNRRDGSVYSTANSPTTVVTCYLMGLCMRMYIIDSEKIYSGRNNERDVLSLTPCAYVQNNSTSFSEDNIFAFSRLFLKAGYFFSWMRSNRFFSDNVDKVVNIGSMAGHFWLDPTIANHGTIHFGNTLRTPMMDRMMYVPHDYYSDVWTWSLPTTICAPGGVIPSGNGLVSVETYSSSNEHPMVISDTPLFELYFENGGTPMPINPLPLAEWQNSWYSQGNVVLDDGDYWGMYIDLGTSASYSAVLDNGYSN